MKRQYPMPITSRLPTNGCLVIAARMMGMVEFICDEEMPFYVELINNHTSIRTELIRQVPLLATKEATDWLRAAVEACDRCKTQERVFATCADLVKTLPPSWPKRVEIEQRPHDQFYRLIIRHNHHLTDFSTLHTSAS
jgi:hypothetical protein